LSPFPLLRGRGIVDKRGGEACFRKGCLRGAEPIFINLSPSLIEGRGIKGVGFLIK